MKFGAVLLLLLAVSAFADQIVLKNGDRLTGSVEKSDGKAVVIKTDYAGELTVKFEAIQSITSTPSGDLTVSLGGKTVTGGSVTTEGEKVVVGEQRTLSTDAGTTNPFAPQPMWGKKKG